MIAFLLWCFLFVLCWPLALLALILYSIVWLLLLPFRLLGIDVHGALVLVWAVVMLPARLLSAPFRLSPIQRRFRASPGLDGRPPQSAKSARSGDPGEGGRPYASSSWFLAARYFCRNCRLLRPASRQMVWSSKPWP